MRTRPLLAALSLLCAVLFGGVAPAPAQTSATAFYLQYREALARATKAEDLLPYVSEKARSEILATPAEERSMLFELMKMMSDMTEVRVTQETHTASGVTLAVEGREPDRGRATGTISIVTEDGRFKIERERWTSP